MGNARVRYRTSALALGGVAAGAHAKEAVMFRQPSKSLPPACNDNGLFFRHGPRTATPSGSMLKAAERDVRPDLPELCGAGRVHHLQPGAYLGPR